MSAAVMTTPDALVMREQSEPRARWLQVMSHTDPRYGGLSAAVPALAHSVAAQSRHEAVLAAFCNAGEQYCPTEVRKDQIRFWPTSRTTWLLDRGLKREFDLTVRGVDALHIHGIWEESTAVSCALARKHRKPYVLSAHGMLEPWALAAKRWKKQVYAALIERANVSRATCLHALTAAEAEQYRKFGAVGPIAVIPNAVEVPEVIEPGMFLDRFPELEEKRIVLFLSRLHPKKGLDLLTEAWSRVARDYNDAQLVIAGPDADGMQPRLAQELKDRGVAGCVTFAGMLSGSMKWSALRAADLSVLPSYSEGLSMALLEAMGAGTAVIATRACNMPEITTAQAGLEIDATVESLTRALQRLLSQSPEESRSQGRNGAALIAERYSSAHVAMQMAAVYDYVLGGDPPANVTFLPGGVR